MKLFLADLLSYVSVVLDSSDGNEIRLDFSYISIGQWNVVEQLKQSSISSMINLLL